MTQIKTICERRLTYPNFKLPSFLYHK